MEVFPSVDAEQFCSSGNIAGKLVIINSPFVIDV